MSRRSYRALTRSETGPVLSSASSILIILLDAAGLSVLAYAVFRWRDGVAPIPFRRVEKPKWNPEVMMVAALWVGFQLVSRLLSEWSLLTTEKPEVSPSSIAFEQVFLMNLLLVAFFLLLLSDSGQNRFSSFGISFDNWWKEAVYGAAGYLAALPAVHAVIYATTAFRPDEAPERKHHLIRLLQEDQSLHTVAWVAVTVIVMAPLAEEIVYRVTVQGALRSRFSAAVSIGASSLLFAGVHGFPDSLALIPLAIVMGYVYERRRSYVAVVVLHALFNATTLLTLLIR